MAILVKNQTVDELLKFLSALSIERNIVVYSPDLGEKALLLYEALLEDQVESEITDLKINGEYPEPAKSGAWIV